MQEDKEEYRVRSLKVEKSKVDRLPLWFSHMLYNKMMPKTDQIDVKDNIITKGYHFYDSYNKPISSIINYSTIRKDE